MARRGPRRGEAVRTPTVTMATTAADGDGLAKAGKRKNNGNDANLGFEAYLSLPPTSFARTSNLRTINGSRSA